MKDASREALTTLTNLPHCGKVVFTKVGCDRFNGKPSRVAPAPAVSSMLAPIVNHRRDWRLCRVCKTGWRTALAKSI